MAQSNNTALNDLVFPFKNYVLALPGWYPTWMDPMPGDFNQRHIMAASEHLPQIVLYIGKDVTGALTKTEVRYNQLSKLVIEIVVIYPQTKIQFFDAVQSNLYFLNLVLKYGSFIKRRWGKPKLLHSYIAIRGGLAGYILGRRWKVPFVLTENWTIYYPDDPGFLLTRNRFFKWSTKRVYKSVSKFLPVTADLNERVAKLLQPVPAAIIPNVVDTEIFFRKDKVSAAGGFRFIHVSTMTYQKNPQGLLRVFKSVHQQHSQATLTLVGPVSDELKRYALELSLNEHVVRFTGNVPYKKVAELLQSADALVMFSRYENLPCVILEALCCGLPVVSTNVGGVREVLNSRNGILVENGNEMELLQALTTLVKQFDRYDPEEISAAAIEKFGTTTVGNQIGQVYAEFVQPD